MYKVSIVIPCYNVGLYINECVFSLKQDEDFGSFEVVLVDDGSTDDTFFKLKAIEALHNNVYVVRQENLGQSAARNCGVEIASADYIGFIDADDWVSKNYFTNLYYEAKRKDLDLVICDLVSVHPNGTIDEMNTRAYKMDEITLFDVDNIEDRALLISLYLKDRISVSPCNKLFRSALLRENNISFPIGLYNEDMEFTFDILMVVSRVGKIMNSIYYYRQNPNSTTKIASLRVLDMLIIVDRILQKVKSQFGSSLRKSEYHFVLNNTAYVSIMRLFHSAKETRKTVISAISEKMALVPISYILLTDFSAKRKVMFLLVKYLPSLFIKLINLKWTSV